MPGRHVATSSSSPKKSQTLARGWPTLKESRSVVCGPAPTELLDCIGEAATDAGRVIGAISFSTRGGGLAVGLEARDTSPSARRQHALDCAHDADVAGAAAQIAGQLLADARLIRRRQAEHDVARGDQHAGRAIAALQRVLGAESFAQIRHTASSSKPSMVRTSSAVAADGIGDAGARRRAVDLDGARAAHAVLAAEMRAGQRQVLAQEVGELQCAARPARSTALR